MTDSERSAPSSDPLKTRPPARRRAEKLPKLKPEGRDDAIIEANKITELAKLLYLPRTLPHAEGAAILHRACDFYNDLEPADGAEGMLAMQMVGAHSAALEALHRATQPNLTTEARDMYLKQAQRMSGVFVKMLAALDKRRGRGQQKVTVEHVNVAAGGQAIVGNVEAGQRRGSTASSATAGDPPMPERQPNAGNGHSK